MSEGIDVFISFSSRDRDDLKPIVNELRARGLNVWWSEYLEEGRWDLQIAKKLEAARRVVGFITPSADNSERDYIVIELERARSAEKLIPVIIGEGGTSFAIQGVVKLLQSYFFDRIDKILGSDKFEKLVAVCGGVASQQFVDNLTPLSPALRVEEWFQRIEGNFGQCGRIEAFSFALAVSIFENAPMVEVESLAHQLSKQLHEIEAPEGETLEVDYPRRRGPLLSLIECQTTELLHPTLGVPHTIVHFKDRDRAAAFIEFTWSEFGNRRLVLKEWFGSIAEHASSEGHIRLGLALGLLAQRHFIDVFSEVISSWLTDESAPRQWVADIALSVAAYDPNAAQALRGKIMAWIHHGTPPEKRAAVRLACGFSGARMPGIAIEVLRQTASANRDGMTYSLVDTMRDAIHRLLTANLNNADNSLFDLPGLVEELAGWAVEDVAAQNETSISERDQRLKENPYPLMLFLLVLDDLPVTMEGKGRSGLSLGALTWPETTARLTATVINKALERPRINTIEIRKPAERIIRRWINDRIKASEAGKPIPSPDPLFELARMLVATAARREDVDRILFLFQSCFPHEKLESAASVNTSH
ncbi:MAG: toll/interleukin-1 receptor domain-containing protein [Rhodomicrobium sp.]